MLRVKQTFKPHRKKTKTFWMWTSFSDAVLVVVTKSLRSQLQSQLLASTSGLKVYTLVPHYPTTSACKLLELQLAGRSGGALTEKRSLQTLGLRFRRGDQTAKPVGLRKNVYLLPYGDAVWSPVTSNWNARGTGQFTQNSEDLLCDSGDTSICKDAVISVD